MALTREQISLTKGMINRGDRQSDIAAFFKVNQGRIGEVSTGDTGPDVPPAMAEDLPPQFLVCTNASPFDHWRLDMFTSAGFSTDKIS